ncbi:hypothetical protein Ocin01_01027 [Orchesella cincta]|uniref:Uncharacterized protein n=1 Tax=Orchesella cincta TaxID=48709 RepID=A0A1D2NK50_ORCCI|nr:hypothetical protein Ocin01_01027 [Orchesella cincta]
MKAVVCFLLFFYFASSIAQITFTREWVKGKRSTTANTAAAAKDGHSVCQNLVTAVEYLIELEKLRRAECLECCHSAPPAFPDLPDIQRSPSDFMQFFRKLPPVEQEQMVRVVPSQESRNQ